jgi:catechol-2,3-dioxygenase
VYYSKYGWQSAAGSYLEDATADTDLVNADSDETRLLEYKMAELGEVHLRSSQIKEKRDLYEAYMGRYKLQYTSLATPIITTYSNINYL